MGWNSTGQSLRGPTGVQGPAGAQGPAGTQGPAGAQGPSGVTTIAGAGDYDTSGAQTDGNVLSWASSSGKYLLRSLSALGAVLSSQRAPFGGGPTTLAVSGTGAQSINATVANRRRIVLDADYTFAAPSGGVDGQEITLELQASGAARTITFAADYETTQKVPGRVFTLPSGTWGRVVLALRAGTWTLIEAWPQSLVATVCLKFTASQTYVLPAGAVSVHVMTYGGGGGGASGNRAASGTACAGGGGGGAGGISEQTIPASELDASITVTVGAAGVGGTAVSSGTAGTAGGNGGTSSISGTTMGVRCWAGSGKGGTASTSGNGAVGGMISGSNGQAPAGGATPSPAGDNWGASGGGAGGGLAATQVALAGGAGGAAYMSYRLGTAGAVGAAGTAGSTSTASSAGQGGTGGASNPSAAAYAGGKGGTYGAGGGGGGASNSSYASGAGGDGSPGMVQLTVFF